MRFDDIEMQGRYLLEHKTTLAPVTSENEARVYYKDGEVYYNDSTAQNKLVKSDLSGNTNIEGAFSSGYTVITSSQTNMNVSGVNHLAVNTASGNVNISGFQGGVSGQILTIYKVSESNTLTIEHEAGTGTQDIFTTDKSNISLSIYGGIVLECNGSDWFMSESGTGSSTQSVEEDIYTDILNDSKYQFLTYDAFQNENLVDTGNTTMTFDLTNTKYTYTDGQVLQSKDLFDSASGLVEVTEAVVSMIYTTDGTNSPTIEVTADGTNWEVVSLTSIHTFTNTGTTLKIRFTGSGTGEVSSWGIFYGPDNTIATIVSNQKMVNFYYEGIAQDEDTFIEGIYFNTRMGISAIAINSRVAPTGANLTIDILKDGVEQTKIATLTAASSYEKTDFTSHAFFDTDERFGLKIKTIGSTEPGQGLNVTIFYYDR